MGATSEQKVGDVQKVLSWCTSLPLTSQIAEQAGTIHQALRRNNRLLEIRDILIGATAIVHDLPVATLNDKHFRRISGLRLFETAK